MRSTMRLIFVTALFLMLGLLVMAQLPSDFEDNDGDGFPDGAKLDADPASTCYSIGYRVVEFLAAPIYYLGMVAYTILYPAIVVVQWLARVASWIAWLLSLIPRLIIFILTWILYIVWVVVSFIPWLIWKLFMWIAGLFGQVVGMALLVLIGLAVIYFVATNMGASCGIALALLALFAAYLVLEYGLSILLMIILCPLQFSWGMFNGLADDMVYWRAVATMNYVSI